MFRTSPATSSRGIRRTRGQWARVAAAVVVLALGFALLKLQVLDVKAYTTLARENRLRPLVLPAPRGAIYDRHGRVIADNVVAYRVELMPGPRDSLQAQLERLTPVLDLTTGDRATAMRKWLRQRTLPMVVLSDANPIQVARLEERRFLFPRVLVNEYPKRHYEDGPAVSHFIGYVAEISEKELAMPRFAGYRQGRWIGKDGLEREYETTLGGEPGMRYLEVDAMGRIKRWLPRSMGVPPIPGRDLHLYLDLDLQRYIEQIFPDSMNGGFIAIDPQTGGVLAYYSSPGFDPNDFVGGIPLNLWTALRQNPRIPLLDRAAKAAQPPGSTFKLAVAAMALEQGDITPTEHMPLPCTGGMTYQGRYARCWYKPGHGYLDLPGAIKNSCDVYFYQVGIKIGLRNFLREGTRLGYGSRTGIDVPGEFSPIFPPSLDWMQERFGYKPQEPEVMSLAIGQGAITMTPLKMAQIYTALARWDGRAPTPRMVDNGKPRPVTLDLHLTPDQIEWLRRGMREVVGPGGTAFLSRLQNWDFMGKTGTAQNPHGPDHAWFVGIGGRKGADHPEIVAAMLLEHGTEGYIASGYVANAVNFYLDRKYGLPFDRYPTARDRFPRGLPVDQKWLYSPVQQMPLPSERANPPADTGNATAPAASQGAAAGDPAAPAGVHAPAG